MRTRAETTERGESPNPEYAGRDWPAAVIAGAYQTGVLGVRSLRRRGVKACCFDCRLDYPGFRSVYGPAHACPDPDLDQEGWIDFMIALAASLGTKPVLIPSADQFVSAIASQAERLADHYVLSAGLKLQGLLANKQTQYALAAQYGMPLPRTDEVKSGAEVAAFSADARFPCLLKPLHFREWQVFPYGHPLSNEKVGIATTPGELIEIWRMASTANPHSIAQEIIEGPDTDKRVYVACYAQSGERLANAVFRELRCDPIQFGPATVTEPIVDVEADAICDDWLRRMGYSGICEIELKRDSRDGQVKLIEANPRLTGGGDAAPYVGVDIAWLHYLDLIGARVTPVTSNGRDIRHIVLRSDAAATIGYLREGLTTWKDVLRSYRPPLAFYDVDWRDWRYSLETIYRMVRAAAGALVRSFSPRRRRRPGSMPTSPTHPRARP